MKFLPKQLCQIAFFAILLLTVTICFFTFCANSSEKNEKSKNLATVNKNLNNNLLTVENDNIFKSVIKNLLEKGVDSAFINKYLNNSNTKFDESFVKVNVTGYLKKADYSYATNPKSVEKSKEFLKKNSTVLLAAEKKYNVPKEIIVAILWVETRLGTYLGKNHIPSVFFSTALVNEQKFIELNYKVVDESDNTDSLKSELKKKVKQRSERKAKWAINELAAMNEIEKKFNIDFNKIYGSWAGAFGVPQFLPSSFLRCAVDGNNDQVIDLFDVSDAIFSVANYLQKGKLGNSTEKKRKAIWSYNNSNDYVDAVLKLSELIKSK